MDTREPSSPSERTNRIDDPHRLTVESSEPEHVVPLEFAGLTAPLGSGRSMTASTDHPGIFLKHDRAEPSGDSLDEDSDLLSDADNDLFQSMRRQANQLAEHLRRRHLSLQEHEALLHDQAAQIEEQLQTAQTWAAGQERRLTELEQRLDERHQRLDDRELLLDERDQAQADQAQALQEREEALVEREKALQAAEGRNGERAAELEARGDELRLVIAQVKAERAELSDRAAAVAAAEAATDAQRLHEQQQWLAKRQAADELLRLRTRGLELRRQAVERQALELTKRSRDQAATLGCREYELKRERAALERRRTMFHEAETALSEERAQLALNRAQWEQTAAERMRQFEAEHERIAHAAEQAEAECQQQRQAIDLRAARLDTRQLELDRLQVKLHQAQQETLEMRLATEELWGQLSGVLPAAALTRSVSRLRSRLADQFRLATDDLAEQRAALELERGRMEDLLSRFVDQRSQLQQWFQRRQDELQTQAAGLAAQEQELQQQQAHLENMRSHWQTEKARYQRELRRLLKDQTASCV